MILVVCAQSSGIIFQGFGVLVVVRLCDHALLVVLAVAVHAGTVAVDAYQVSISVLVAVQSSVQAQVGDGGVQGGLLLLAQGEALFHSQLIHSVGALDVGVSQGDEVISPGLAGLGVVGLITQGSLGVQHVADVGAVVVVEGADSVYIEVVQLNGVHFVIADLYSNSVLVDNVLNGVHQDAAQSDAHAQNDHDPKAHGINFGLFGFCRCSFLLAKLLLVGCTHEIISSQIVLMVFTRR